MAHIEFPDRTQAGGSVSERPVASSRPVYTRLLRRLVPLLLCAALVALTLPSRAEAPVLRIATLEWPPYVGRDLPDQGLWAELAREAARRMNRSLELSILPWNRALLGAEQGRFEAVMPAQRSADREQGYHFSRPLPGGAVGLVARRADGLAWTSLADLRDKRLGVVRGYLNTPEIDEDPSWSRDPAPDDLHNLRKLLLGRIDLVVIDRYVAAHHLRGELAERALEIVDLGPALSQRDLHVMFPLKQNGGRALCEGFDGALEAMQADGTLASLFAKHHLEALLSPEAPAEPPAEAPPR